MMSLKDTWLGKLLKNDPLFGKALVVVLIIYAFAHLVIEIYPFYTFGMFSVPESVHSRYPVIEVYFSGQKEDFGDLDYRRYIYLNNTLVAYDRIMETGQHPEAKVISKYLDFSGLSGTPIASLFLNPHRYDRSVLSSKIKKWLQEFFENEGDVTIVRSTYSFDGDMPRLIDQKTMTE